MSDIKRYRGHYPAAGDCGGLTPSSRAMARSLRPRDRVGGHPQRYAGLYNFVVARVVLLTAERVSRIRGLFGPVPKTIGHSGSRSAKSKIPKYERIKGG